jgi:trimeric autotransporter adhesin
MNRLIQLHKSNSLFVIAFSLVCFAVVPTAWAVTPAPDGGYPGGNTAEGTNALHNRTNGQYNTAVGLSALYGDQSGGRNTGLGVQTLRFNVAGVSNTAVGVNALYRNTNNYNTAIGDSALFSNTSGNQNTADGYQALYSNVTGVFNTAIGSLALLHNTNHANTAIGSQALRSNTTGGGNTAIGFLALDNNIVGGDNTAIGEEALESNTSGSNNIALGAGAGSGVITANNVICIGANVSGANVSNSCFIGSIFGHNGGFGAAAVYINSSGELGTTPSSKRFKEHIKPMDNASDALLALKPVTFRYKGDAKGTPQFGLIAEEVAEVNPDLVVRDKDGKPYSVRYEQINAMLLNEFLKEHRTVQEQGATITRQRKDFETAIAQQEKKIEALTATVKHQAAQIQKVSAQLELSKSAPQTVLNNQ